MNLCTVRCHVVEFVAVAQTELVQSGGVYAQTQRIVSGDEVVELGRQVRTEHLELFRFTVDCLLHVGYHNVCRAGFYAHGLRLLSFFTVERCGLLV